MFFLIPVAGFLGSKVVLVAGAQTFESLKDLVVLVGLLLFGYPALLAIPPAYMLSDLIEGTPPSYLLDWFVGYFINPACFWVAYQLIGRNPDFRLARTWAGYLGAAAVFLLIEPQLWGFICSGKYTPEISYRSITPALFFTTSLTWTLAPFVMLILLPLARRYDLFWAEIPGRVKEKLLWTRDWLWESGCPEEARRQSVESAGLPLRVFIGLPFITVMVLVVGTVAYLTLRSGDEATNVLASRLHRVSSLTITMGMDDFLDQRRGRSTPIDAATLGAMLQDVNVGKVGRIFILDREGRLVASSLGLAQVSGDAVTREAIRGMVRSLGDMRAYREARQFRFDVITARPLSRVTWLAQATPYQNISSGTDWIVVTATPADEFLGPLQAASSRTAMVVAGALFASLLLAAVLAGRVTAPLRQISRSVRLMAQGDLAQRVSNSSLVELDALASSFNLLARQLQESFDKLKASEAEIRQLNTELERRVAERTTQLAAANEELEAFSYSVSHDLRAPLRSIDGFSLALLEDYRDRLDATGKDYLVRVRSASQRMAGLIDDMLQLSRLTRGALKLERVDLSAMAREIATDLRERDPQRQVDVLIAENLYATGDARLLRSVLENLLGNAWKFTGKHPRARIEFGTVTRDGQSAFFVRDDGAGFKMAYADKLFKPFSRLHTQAEFEGSGIGLATIQRVIHRHGGRVWAEAEVERGATFYFTLAEEVP